MKYKFCKGVLQNKPKNSSTTYRSHGILFGVELNIVVSLDWDSNNVSTMSNKFQFLN